MTLATRLWGRASILKVQHTPTAVRLHDGGRVSHRAEIRRLTVVVVVMASSLPHARSCARSTTSSSFVHNAALRADALKVTEQSRTPPSIARIVVPAAVAVGAVYLGWRLGWTRSEAEGWLFWPLWLAELSIWVVLVRMTAEMWTLRFDPRRPGRTRKVDVVVLCRDEPLEVLRATLLGCSALRGPHRSVALDTVGRADLAALAGALGIDHLTAASSEPAAAPEVHLNAVLDQLDGELIAVLHGDDVPLPGMLEELAGDFTDDDVWLAQGRQALYGPSSGEHRGATENLGWFFGVVQPGKNHHRATFWCGSGGILRRRALEELGGIPVTTDTPNFELSLGAHESGWRSTYHPTPVVLSLARPDVEGFVTRRSLWAHGNLQSLRTRRSPLFARGLTVAQRLSYLGTMLTYLGGPRRVTFIAVLAGMLLTGALPLVADPVLLVALWGLWMGSFLLARRLLARGNAPDVAAQRENWLLLGADCTAWLGLLVPRSVVAALRSPVPTPGHRHGRPHVRVRLLLLASGAVALAAAARIAAAVEIITLPPLSAAASSLALAAAMVLLATVASALTGALERRRRSEPRFTVESTATIGGVEAALLEVSESGASVLLARPAMVGCPYIMNLHVPGLDGTVHQATVAAEVRSVRPSPTPELGHVVGLSFTHLSGVARERLAEYCRILLPARAAAVATLDDPEPVPHRRRRRPPRSRPEASRAGRAQSG